MQDIQLPASGQLSIPDEQRPAALIRHAARSGVHQTIAAATLLAEHDGGRLLRDSDPMSRFLTLHDADGQPAIVCDWTGLYDSISLREPEEGQDPQDWIVQILACALAVDRAVHRLGWLLGLLDHDTFRTAVRAVYVAAHKGMPPLAGWPAPGTATVPLYEALRTEFLVDITDDPPPPEQ